MNNTTQLETRWREALAGVEVNARAKANVVRATFVFLGHLSPQKVAERITDSYFVTPARVLYAHRLAKLLREGDIDALTDWI